MFLGSNSALRSVAFAACIFNSTYKPIQLTVGSDALQVTGNTHMPTGTVKWFNSTKGFGFIQPDKGGQTFSSTSPPWNARVSRPSLTARKSSMRLSRTGAPASPLPAVSAKRTDFSRAPASAGTTRQVTGALTAAQKKERAKHDVI